MLEPVHHPHVHVDHSRGFGGGLGEAAGLSVVVGENMVGHVVGHRHQELITLFEGQITGCHGLGQEDLEVHLVIGAVDAGRVVDGVGVDPTTLLGELDPTPLCDPEIAALGQDAATQLDTVDANVIIAAVADLEIGLGGRLHVRADATVPQQVDRGAKNGTNHLGGRKFVDVVVDPECRSHRWGDGDRLVGPRNTPPPLEICARS